MKLNAIQWLWLAASLLFFGAILLDVANLFNVPGSMLIVLPALLLVIGLFVGPSLKDLTGGTRRG